MKKITLASIFSFLITACSGQSKDAQNNLKNELLTPKQLSVISKKVKNFPNATQFSFAFIDGDTVTYYGVEREDDHLITISNENRVFEIGSISKVFTSTLLADAVIRDQVALHDLISLPLKDGIQVTYAQLANHTSGFPRLPANIFEMPAFRTDNPYKDYSAGVLKAYLKEQLTLDQKPGSAYAYSNLGAGLLGYVLSTAEGKSYDTLLKEQIFSKYEMQSSTTQKKEIEGQLVEGRDKKGKPTSNWDLASLAGAGGIFSTTTDLAKFAQAQFNANDEVLALTRNPTFTVQKNMDIGLGWHIIKTKSGDTWYWHNGGTGGYSSSMAIDVQHQKAIIILSNVSAFHNLNKNIDPMCFELMKAF